LKKFKIFTVNIIYFSRSKNIQIPHNTKPKAKDKKGLNKQKDLKSSRSFKSDSESRLADTSEYFECATSKRRYRSADETLDDEDINAFDGSKDNYEDNLSIIQNFAIENVNTVKVSFLARERTVPSLCIFLTYTKMIVMKS